VVGYSEIGDFGFIKNKMDTDRIKIMSERPYQYFKSMSMRLIHHFYIFPYEKTNYSN
jgi:hypothetical protein